MSEFLRDVVNRSWRFQFHKLQSRVAHVLLLLCQCLSVCFGQACGFNLFFFLWKIFVTLLTLVWRVFPCGTG